MNADRSSTSPSAFLQVTCSLQQRQQRQQTAASASESDSVPPSGFGLHSLPVSCPPKTTLQLPLQRTQLTCWSAPEGPSQTAGSLPVASQQPTCPSPAPTAPARRLAGRCVLIAGGRRLTGPLTNWLGLSSRTGTDKKLIHGSCHSCCLRFAQHCNASIVCVHGERRNQKTFSPDARTCAGHVALSTSTHLLSQEPPPGTPNP